MGICLLIFAACSGPDHEADATETATASATRVAEVESTATHTPEPIATAMFSATPLPTSTPTPTSTVTATSIPTPTVTATATARPPEVTTTSISEPTALPPSTSTPEPTPPAATSAPTPTAETSAFNADGLQRQAAALLEDQEGLYSVSVMLPDGSVAFELNSHESMEAASLYKLELLIEAYRQRSLGVFTFDDTLKLYPGYFKEVEYDDPFDVSCMNQAVAIGDLIEGMVTVSSNVAAWALLDKVTNSRANLTMESLGATDTEIRWMPRRELTEPHDFERPVRGRCDGSGASTQSGSANARYTLLTGRADAAWQVTTAHDMATLFVRLLNGDAVDPQSDQEMLDLLAQQRINDRLPADLPSDAVVAHKPGNLPGLIHDAGVLYTPHGPVVIAVLTENAPNATAIIAQLARIAWDLK